MMKPVRRLSQETMFDFQIILLTSDTWILSSFIVRITYQIKKKIKAKFRCLENLKAPHHLPTTAHIEFEEP